MNFIWTLLTQAGGGTGTGGAEGSEPATMNPVTLVIMGLLVVAVIGLFVWQTVSGKKKQKEAQNMVNQLKIGDRVKTIGGICGFVAQINDAENTFVLETGLEETKSFIKFDKGAIYQTAPAQGNAVVAENAPEVKAEEKETLVEEKAKEEKPAKKTTKKTAKKTEEQK